MREKCARDGRGCIPPVVQTKNRREGERERGRNNCSVSAPEGRLKRETCYEYEFLIITGNNGEQRKRNHEGVINT